MVYLEVCKCEKKYFRLENIFRDYHRLEYRDRYVVCKFEGRGIFFKRDIQPRVKRSAKMHENIINFKALPIFLPKGDSRGFSICHS